MKSIISYRAGKQTNDLSLYKLVEILSTHSESILSSVIRSVITVDTVDWREERSAETILGDVLPKLVPGSIVLCHNNGFKIESYLPVLLEEAQAQGFVFVTVDKLLLEGETIIDVNGMQKKA